MDFYIEIGGATDMQEVLAWKKEWVGISLVSKPCSILHWGKFTRMTTTFNQWKT